MNVPPFFQPNFPFAPSRSPFFYGWLIVIFTTLGTLASLPGQTMGIGVFTDYLISNTNLSRMQISISYMIGTILSSLLNSSISRFLVCNLARYHPGFANCCTRTKLFYNLKNFFQY